MSERVKLQVNVDHVATLRQARGTSYPDPLQAALECEAAGADGITIHLREDRRHIQDHDVSRIRHVVRTLLNLEMAATEEMVRIACAVRPHLVTLVPERREERTTEGGLDVVTHYEPVARIVKKLDDSGISVSLFIAPEKSAIEAAIDMKVHAIELHTGEYAHAFGAKGAQEEELERLARAATFARGKSDKLVVAAGHGLHRDNVRELLGRVPEIVELNVGHAIVADAIFLGMKGAVSAFRSAMDRSK